METKISNGNLISRSELLEKIQSYISEHELINGGFVSSLVNIIENAPTAIGRSAEEIAKAVAEHTYWDYDCERDCPAYKVCHRTFNMAIHNHLNYCEVGFAEWLKGSADNE